MAELNTVPTQAPAVPPAGGNNFVKRELNGATFLSLEHLAHMVLIVLVPALITSAIAMAMNLWWGAGSPTDLLALPGMNQFATHAALTLVAALITLVPALYVLDRRTRAEWLKRPGYSDRLAYKVPVYGAVGVLAATLVALKIKLLAVVLSSLALIGVEGADISSMYLHDFLPSLISLLVFTFAFWYVFMLAKGQDHGKTFSAVLAVVGAAMVVALFITAVVTARDKPTTDPYSTPPTYPSQEKSLDELYKQYGE